MVAKKQRADVTFVKLDDQGIIEIEGLCLFWEEEIDKKFMVSVTQIEKFLQRYANGFPFLVKNASRDIKAILGKESPFFQVASVLNSKKVNCLTLKDFRKLLFKLSKKDKSIENLVDILLDYSLTKQFAKAFDVKWKREEQAQWLEQRLSGKVTRRTLTDAIKDYIHDYNLTGDEAKWIYSNVTEIINKGIFNRSAKQLKKDWDTENTRNAMTNKELGLVKQAEDLTMRLIDQDSMYPECAAKEALNRLIISTQNR